MTNLQRILFLVTFFQSTARCNGKVCNNSGVRSFECNVNSNYYDVLLPRLASDPLHLTLIGGRYASLQGKPFYKYIHLISLKIISNNLQVVKNSGLEGLINLKTLNIQGQLNSVDEDAFKHCPHLETLDLSSNKIDTIRPFSLAAKQLNRLEKLIFNDNTDLKSIDAYDLLPLQNSPVSHIDLSRCNIKSIAKGAFSLIKNVSCLLLNGNSLTVKDVTNVLYEIPPTLKVLGLKHLNLSEIPTEAFEHLYYTKIEQLLLEGNNLKEIKTENFPSLPYLKILDISDNKLELIDGSVFKKWGNLEKLYLTSNHLTQIPSNLSFMMTKLIHLDLSHNDIQLSRHISHFNSMPNLNYLDLSNNNITYNPLLFEEGLKRLETLQMSYNLILPWKKCVIFEKNMALKKLYVVNNRLSVVTTAMLADFKELKYVYLHGNPFDCTRCIMYDFAKWIIETVNNQYAMCSKPEGVLVKNMELSYNCRGGK